jgi:hypothetical protein
VVAQQAARAKDVADIGGEATDLGGNEGGDRVHQLLQANAPV